MTLRHRVSATNGKRWNRFVGGFLIDVVNQPNQSRNLFLEALQTMSNFFDPRENEVFFHRRIRNGHRGNFHDDAGSHHCDARRTTILRTGWLVRLIIDRNRSLSR